MWLALLAALCPPDGKLIWRRRIAVSTAATAQVAFLHAVFAIGDIDKARLVMNGAIELLGIVFSIYVAGAAVHAGLNRGRPAPAAGDAQ